MIEDFHDLASIHEWQRACEDSLTRAHHARERARRRRRERVGVVLCLLAVIVTVLMFGLPR